MNNPLKTSPNPNQPINYLAGIPILLLLAYCFYPTFAWMWERWFARDSYYAHGLLIPIVSLYWLFRHRDKIAASYQENHPVWALGILLTAVAIQLFSSFFRVYFISCFAFVILLLGITGYLLGSAVFKKTWYPLSFLFLMIPLPLIFIAHTTLQMKFFVSEIAVKMIGSTGIQAVREGSYIHMPNAVMMVGDPCSGLRSFLAFLCLGFVFAYESQVPVWKKWVIISAGLPLAILSNVVRVFILGILAEIYGNEFIEGKVHDASGVFVFILALTLLLSLRRMLEKGNASEKIA